MYTGVFDYATLLIYLIIGILGASLIGQGIKYSNGNELIKTNFNLYYKLFIVLFVIFATIRKVDTFIGGQDALSYVNDFLSANNTSVLSIELDSEFVFYLFEKIIRLFTDNYKIYFFICYFIIALSYVVFIKTFAKSNEYLIAPFILLIFLYLKSFCTLRSSLAVAIFMFGLSIFQKNKKTGVIFILSTFFIHRMSILYILFLFFYLLLGTKVKKISGIKLGMFTLVLLVVAYLGAISLRDQVIAMGLLDGTDAWYIKQSAGSSILSRWPMYFSHILLIIAMMFSGTKIGHSKEILFLKVLCIFDIIVMPASVVVGFWRANEFLYVARLMMWGHVIYVNTIGMSRKIKLVFNLMVAGLFVAWLVFRIYSEWDDLKIMPYVIGY